MKKYNTVMKVKDIEEKSIISKLLKINSDYDSVNEQILDLDREANRILTSLNSSNQDEVLSLKAILDSIKCKKVILNTQLSKINTLKMQVESELISKRTEIKAIEKLIAKRKEEIIIKELRKEDNFFDELNNAEYTY